MRLPAEVTSVEGFIDLVVQLASHGYYFWVQGDVRNRRGLSPDEIDRRQIERYNANLPKRARSYQRSKGNASVRYVRYGLEWYLFWTHQVNKARQHVGFDPVPSNCIRFHRKMISPYKRVDAEMMESTQLEIQHLPPSPPQAAFEERQCATVTLSPPAHDRC